MLNGELSLNFACFLIDLIACTDSDNVSVPSLAELLFERSRMSSWVIVSKSLVTFHNLMSAGNEVSSILTPLIFLAVWEF